MFKRFFTSYIFLICSALLGAIVFFLLYSELLNPSYINWIMWISGDPLQHYLGWEFFRDSSWSFPIGHISHLVYPAGIPLTFTDSIPLFALFFKLFSPWLPFPFQFDGIWILTCFILQGIFGYLLLYQYLEKRPLAALGSLFFVLSPIMLFRLGGHSALGAHWLLLWSLLLILKSNENIRIWQWTAILALTVLIHPYLLFMCGALFVADLVRRVACTKILSWEKGSTIFVLETIVILLLSYVVGIFAVGNGAASGYGVFSLDLNGLINPYGWSTIIKNMNVREPNEGFAYLGLGILVLLGLSIYEWIRTKTRKEFFIQLRAWWPIVVITVILVCVAITNIVSIWGREFVLFPLWAPIRDHVFGIVRSSGRLFWPVYYLIVLGAFFVIKKSRPRFAYGLIIFALVLQVYDIKDKLFELNNFYARSEWQDPLQDPFWQEIAQTHAHISFVPTYAPGMYEAIALFAVRHNLTLNIGYVVRAAGLINEQFMETEQAKLMEGNVDDHTLYIFLDNNTGKKMTEKVDKTKYELKIIDGYTVLAPVSRAP